MKIILILFFLVVPLPCLSFTPIPKNFDNLVESAQFILSAKVEDKAPVYKCVGKACEQGYLYFLEPENILKGSEQNIYFCSTYSYEEDKTYLFFLTDFNGYLMLEDGSVGQTCDWSSVFHEGNVFRFSAISGETVIDIANPPQIFFPVEIKYYEARDDDSRKKEVYFSADWSELKKYSEDKLSEF